MPATNCRVIASAGRRGRIKEFIVSVYTWVLMRGITDPQSDMQDVDAAFPYENLMQRIHVFSRQMSSSPVAQKLLQTGQAQCYLPKGELPLPRSGPPSCCPTLKFSPGFSPSVMPSIAALAAGWPLESVAGEAASSYSTSVAGATPKGLRAFLPSAASKVGKLYCKVCSIARSKAPRITVDPAQTFLTLVFASHLLNAEDKAAMTCNWTAMLTHRLMRSQTGR